MENPLWLYNSKSRKKEQFLPLSPPFVGMYLCGPTVYGHAHLGHSRGAITFDVLFRYLKYLGYKVRYVRNITDVGHLENDADEGEDKIAKKARLEALEPMEVAQFYTNSYQNNMRQLNTEQPSIEPRATGHIIEQIRIVQSILDAGYAYEVDGSVYFDVVAYSKDHEYGALSGRVLEDLMQSDRDLEGQDDKKNSVDFALWKKASPEHIMRWPSPWSNGFPGWHLECTAMSTKYLGDQFDIHGGGMDLLFPHHECEIAQSHATTGVDPVKYWLHNNMITIDGQKMAKSLGNFITLNDLFTGNHDALSQAFSPMTMRFFILQAHYRSTLDFSNDALLAAEKGYKRLIAAARTLNEITPSDESTFNIDDSISKAFKALNDDLSTPIAIAELFDLSKKINQIKIEAHKINSSDLEKLKTFYTDFVFGILGFQNEETDSADSSSDLVDLVVSIRTKAKQKKEFELSDFIRDELSQIGFEIRDVPGGTEWKRK